ncbi:MAG: FKBP-type peptidyl-prolyl cis-trans isomerase FkpA [Ancylomarina sp.]|jgi:FKBP-type peptidyl-prolyl cis-trans isomerase FkpA
MRYTLLVLVIALFASCSDDEQTNYIEKNDNEIIEYIATHNLDAKKSSTGLYYVIDKPGTGKDANPNSYVNVYYKGHLINGDVFDESNSNGIYTYLQQVILGWTEGISYFKEGGSGKLLIPSHLAYGDSSTESIPKGSVLIFDIELIEVYDDIKSLYKSKNEQEITTYITDNDLVAQKTDSGLYYIIEEQGTGDQPTASSNVTVAYKGYLINNGRPFDQSEGYTIDLQRVIQGWTEGIPYFKEGGKGKLLIPSHLAYGPEYFNNIPGGSTLVFDIHLIKVN